MDVERLFQKSELIPAVVQEAGTGEVLMLAYMNRESLEKHLRPDIPGSTAVPDRNCGTREQPPATYRRWLISKQTVMMTPCS